MNFMNRLLCDYEGISAILLNCFFYKKIVFFLQLVRSYMKKKTKSTNKQLSMTTNFIISLIYQLFVSRNASNLGMWRM